MAADTETSGLRPYHGDRLFSIIIANHKEGFYFNFKAYPGLEEDLILTPHHLVRMNDLFSDPQTLWYFHNAANFDLPILAKDGIDVAGPVHCTKAIARVEDNAWPDYSLAECLQRIGLAKSEAVDEYITKNGLYEKVKVPGKAQKETVKHFDRVPYDIIVPYGEQDGTGTFALGATQLASIMKQDAEQPPLVQSNRTLMNVMQNEIRLQKTIFRMKHVGVKIDRAYCLRAAAFEADRAEKSAQAFKKETGREYAQSPKLFAEIFASEKEKWKYTDKHNPSFDKDALALFDNPGAKLILELRDAKSKADFYHGFLYHADSDDVVHPNYNPDGAVHGRFSSSAPNFQNLTSEDSDEEIAGEFIVRRAIIPRPGFVLIMPDYDQMEYKFMLEQACRILGHATDFSRLVSGGMDFHDATKENVKAVTQMELVRKQIKIVNFMTLYGSGDQNIADTMKVPLKQASAIKKAILTAAPEVNTYLKTMRATAEQRGFIVNWLGRRCHFPRRNDSFKAPNYHTSGGCADVVKVAMNAVDEALLGLQSRMVMTVHDELPIEVHESEIDTVPRLVKELMESAYTSQYVPLTTGMEFSTKSLGDKIKGFPDGAKA